MYELTAENIKNRIRIDIDYDDNEIENLLLPAAKREIKGAVTSNEDFYDSDEEIKALFNLAVLNTIGHNYENRSTTSQFERVEISKSSLAHIQALRGEYAKWKSANSNTE